MPYKDLHSEPFDETTIFKLEIFEDYAQAWIPTFVMQPYISEIHIFDFFSGTGYDKAGVEGSPIRLLKKIQEHKGNLFQQNVQVVLYLNEYEPNKKDQVKFQLLKASCDKFLNSDKSLKTKVSIRYFNEDFENLFPKLLPDIKKYPALVYLDQNGIKFLSEKYFLQLEKIKQTDFLYFVSSSYFWRFGEGEEFQLHLDIDMKKAKAQGYKKIHRTITEHIRHKLPINSKLKLFPFSLRKGVNIHGIIFGASHPKAVDIFLGIGWKRNGENGDANFDIDDEAQINQRSLFDPPRLSKVDSFKKEVENRILNKEITTNKELLDFTYSEGHISQHAKDCLIALKKAGKVSFDHKSPFVNYDNVYKKKRIISYRVE